MSHLPDKPFFLKPSFRQCIRATNKVSLIYNTCLLPGKMYVYKWVFYLHVCVYTMYVKSLEQTVEGIIFPGAKVMDGWANVRMLGIKPGSSERTARSQSTLLNMCFSFSYSLVCDYVVCMCIVRILVSKKPETNKQTKQQSKTKQTHKQTKAKIVW